MLRELFFAFSEFPCHLVSSVLFPFNRERFLVGHQKTVSSQQQQNSPFLLVVFFGTPSLILLDYYPAVKRLNHVTCHTLCADWLSLHVKLGDCSPPATFYLIVCPVLRAFTQVEYFFMPHMNNKQRNKIYKKKTKLLITFSISMYIMCVILCLFSALSRRVGALQMPTIIKKTE